MTSFQDLTTAPVTGKKTVLLFWADWHEGSAGAMTQILDALASSLSSLQFARVQAEQVPSVSKQYQVTVVPTFVLLDEAGTVVERLEGIEDAAQVTQAVSRLEQRSPAMTAMTANGDDNPTTSSISGNEHVQPLSEEELLNQRLKSLISSAEVMLFMKGVPSAPRCGFSRQVVELLQQDKIAFGSFDILQDEAVRQGLKKYSDWPTYPQLYVNGELVGGLDILQEMKQDEAGLREQLGVTSAIDETPLSLKDRLKELTHQSRVMLFMKGLPSAPRCGFSRKMVEILEDEGVAYQAFDILQDEEVRQGLKEYSDWPTYPQLYHQGELVGGLDIVQEMKEDNSLKELLNAE